MEKITVIIPVFNTQEFLRECLSSVLNQSYKNLEVLIINDGSNEMCRKEIEEFAKRDERITCYHFEHRRGVGAARNAGLKYATGDYVYFLDSDDYLAGNTLQLLIENIGDSPMLSGKIKNVTKKTIEEKIERATKVTYDKHRLSPFYNQSILNRLIRKNFVEKFQLKFSEDVECYSDLEFLVPAIIHMDCFQVLNDNLYFQRTRNDPITNPSLMQQNEEQRVTDYLKMYSRLRNTYSNEEIVVRYLDRTFLEFYHKTMIGFFNNQNNFNLFFDKLSQCAKHVKRDELKEVNFSVKRQLRLLSKNKKEKSFKAIKNHNRLLKWKAALKGRSSLYIQLYRSFFMKMPLKEKTIVFESFLGKSYSDSPKYLYEYMLKNNMDYNYVWIFNEKGRTIPGNPKQVKRLSLAYYYYLATSKYWISNSRMPKQLDKREGNVYIQTWHGTPLKKLVFDMNDIHSANPNYKEDFFKQSRRWDYLVSANQYSSDIFRRAFKFEKEMLEFGYPRNDILYHKDIKRLSDTVKRRLGIPLEKKVVLYAPTWRDDEFYKPGKYKFSLKLDLQAMKKELCDEYVVILRTHYFIADHIDTTGMDDFVYNLSKYDDIAELYVISDLLITDYSSVFFDYANLRRPILFYTYDLEKYRDILRGFYLDMENEIPGPILKTTDEVIRSIQRLERVQEEYQSKYDLFYSRFCSWDNGSASEQIVKRVFGN